MKTFHQYLNESSSYDWKKDFNNPDYDDGTHTLIDKSGFKIWKNERNETHRDGDKPAYIDSNVLQWYINGKLHREGDKPSILFKTGEREWYKDNLSHRDGNKPAYIDSDGERQWWVNNTIVINIGLKHITTALEEDFTWSKTGQFKELIKNKDIPYDIQKQWIGKDPGISKYIKNLHPDFQDEKSGADTGLF